MTLTNFAEGKKPMMADHLNFDWTPWSTTPAPAVVTPPAVDPVFAPPPASVPVDPTGGYWNPSSVYNAKYTDAQLMAMMKAQFSDQAYAATPEYVKYVRGAMDFLGWDIPQGCNLHCKTWGSRTAAYRFIKTIDYLQKFNFKLKWTQEDCVYLNNIITAIDNESINVQQQRVAGSLGVGETGEQIAILGNLKNSLTTYMATADCTKYLNDKAQAEFLNTVQDQIQTASTTEDASNQGTKYIIWGMLGVVAIVSLVIVFKKS